MGKKQSAYDARRVGQSFELVELQFVTQFLRAIEQGKDVKMLLRSPVYTRYRGKLIRSLNTLQGKIMKLEYAKKQLQQQQQKESA